MMGKVDLNLRIDTEVLRELEASGIDPARLAEATLVEAARSRSDAKKAVACAAENIEAIKAHRERIEKYGVFGDDLRTW
jgi:antitoxin CcdA